MTFSSPRLAVALVASSAAAAYSATAPPGNLCAPDHRWYAAPGESVCNLNSRELGDRGAAAVAASLSEPSDVTKLWLALNHIGQVGAAALGKMIRRDKRITELGLSNNEILDAGAASLAAAIKGNTAVRELFLRSNLIGDDGARAIADMLLENRAVEELDLSRNAIGDAGASALAAALQSSSAAVRKLNLKVNRITDSGARELAKMLEVNTILVELKLGGADISPHLLKTIATRLERNKANAAAFGKNKKKSTKTKTTTKTKGETRRPKEGKPGTSSSKGAQKQRADKARGLRPGSNAAPTMAPPQKPEPRTTNRGLRRTTSGGVADAGGDLEVPPELQRSPDAAAQQRQKAYSDLRHMLNEANEERGWLRAELAAAKAAAGTATAELAAVRLGCDHRAAPLDEAAQRANETAGRCLVELEQCTQDAQDEARRLHHLGDQAHVEVERLKGERGTLSHFYHSLVAIALVLTVQFVGGSLYRDAGVPSESNGRVDDSSHPATGAGGTSSVSSRVGAPSASASTAPKSKIRLRLRNRAQAPGHLATDGATSGSTTVDRAGQASLPQRASAHAHAAAVDASDAAAEKRRIEAEEAKEVEAIATMMLHHEGHTDAGATAPTPGTSDAGTGAEAAGAPGQEQHREQRQSDAWVVVPARGALPDGWESRKMVDGRLLYVHHPTQTTQFEDPRKECPPPYDDALPLAAVQQTLLAAATAGPAATTATTATAGVSPATLPPPALSPSPPPAESESRGAIVTADGESMFGEVGPVEVVELAEQDGPPEEDAGLVVIAAGETEDGARGEASPSEEDDGLVVVAAADGEAGACDVVGDEGLVVVVAADGEAGACDDVGPSEVDECLVVVTAAADEEGACPADGAWVTVGIQAGKARLV